MNGRYYKFSEYLKNRYGEKVWKISVDAGFSCPNKDCETGEGGCIFCRLDSFSKVESQQNISVQNQIKKGLQTGKEQFGINKFIVYFQASTNTFASVKMLRELFFNSINYDGVVGLSISTRPDCLPPKVIALIAELSEQLDVWVELGLQSTHDKTLQLINRGHSYLDYIDAVEKLSQLNVRICTHLMFGLPGETKKHLEETAHRIAPSQIHEVKLHPLLVLKNTTLEQMFNNGDFKALERQDYVEQVCDFIERMPEHFVMQRLTAEAPEDILIEPRWSLKKMHLLNLIENEFKRRGTKQGTKFLQ